MKGNLIFITLILLCAAVSHSWGENRVLSLDGDGDYVEMADSESLNAINSQVTMEAWIKATAFRTQWTFIVYKGDKRVSNQCGNRSYILSLNSSGSIHLVSAPSGQAQIYLNSPSGLIELNTWYHVAGVIDARNGVMKIFINGAEVARRDFGKDMHISSLPFQIGHASPEEGALGHAPFEGQIDEVRVWNISRTQEEIQRTMHTTLSGKEPGLVGYWRFDDVGDTVTDSSPSRSDGKLIGDAHLVESELPGPGELIVATVISGTITDEAGRSVPNASVNLKDDVERISQTQTDASGSYLMAISRPGSGKYDLSATSGELGIWRLGIPLREGESRTVNLTLKKANSISGTLLMMDDATPHADVVVQALRSSRGMGDSPHSGKMAATTLSDDSGRYRFINLKPGRYQVRCQTLNGYMYYEKGGNGRKWEYEELRRRGSEEAGKRVSDETQDESASPSLIHSPTHPLTRPSSLGDILRVEAGKPPPFYTRAGFVISAILVAFLALSTVYASLWVRQQRKKGTFEPIPNPYIVGNPIRSKGMFFGREDEFQFIHDKLVGTSSGLIIVLAGERRSGKTSILYQVLNGRLGERFIPVFIDMQAMAVQDDAEFFQQLAQETNRSVSKSPLTPLSERGESRAGLSERGETEAGISEGGKVERIFLKGRNLVARASCLQNPLRARASCPQSRSHGHRCLWWRTIISVPKVIPHRRSNAMWMT